MSKKFFFETIAVGEDKKEVRVFVMDENNKAKLVFTKVFERNEDVDYERLKKEALKKEVSA